MIVNLLRRLRRDTKGQGLVEYGLIIAGVALVCAAAISIFGHKTNDLIAVTTTVLPGAHPADNNPIQASQLIETTVNGNGAIALDTTNIANGQDRYQGNLGFSAEDLVVDSDSGGGDPGTP